MIKWTRDALMIGDFSLRYYGMLIALGVLLGVFLAMKSVESDAELAASQHAIAILGGAVEAVRDYAIPGTDVRHRLIVVEKVKKTPEKYPRMFAKIKKNPL